mmetsp:Transcript_30422/g.78888  ORF Transcript_30422/g.78888 Transcript_30422/m.78888 type:complete len:240 (-) Transcript_30422:1223-1942(-)
MASLHGSRSSSPRPTLRAIRAFAATDSAATDAGALNVAVTKMENAHSVPPSTRRIGVQRGARRAHRPGWENADAGTRVNVQWTFFHTRFSITDSYGSKPGHAVCKLPSIVAHVHPLASGSEQCVEHALRVASLQDAHGLPSALLRTAHGRGATIALAGARRARMLHGLHERVHAFRAAIRPLAHDGPLAPAEPAECGERVEDEGAAVARHGQLVQVAVGAAHGAVRRHAERNLQPGAQL